MDALPVLPAVAISFGATYYLGKACLMLVMSSLEQPRPTSRKESARPPVQAPPITSADTIIN